MCECFFVLYMKLLLFYAMYFNVYYLMLDCKRCTCNCALLIVFTVLLSQFYCQKLKYFILDILIPRYKYLSLPVVCLEFTLFNNYQ